MKKRRALKSYYITCYFPSVVAGNAPPLARGPRADFSVLRRCVKRSIIEFQGKRENASENRLGKGGRELTSPRSQKMRNLRSGAFRRHSPPKRSDATRLEAKRSEAKRTDPRAASRPEAKRSEPTRHLLCACICVCSDVLLPHTLSAYLLSLISATTGREVNR